MYLKSVELVGFKSFGKKTEMVFRSAIASIVGPNGSGKSNVAEAFRFVLGEQSMKSMRSKKGEDLIWGGSSTMPRANRASVKVVFDNSSRLLDLDFDEVVIERTVYRDGQNEYSLNGTQVRLKDVMRLLAGANIGGSGYQIISQGEADRILGASPRERREMVEDALGLKLYQHKKVESEKKLEETAANMNQTRSLRREIAPHLHFLKTQVETIERARAMQQDLAGKLNDYLARENAWIAAEDSRLTGAARAYEHEIGTLREEIERAQAEEHHDVSATTTSLTQTLHEKESKLAEARHRAGSLTRELGKLEGMLEALTARESAPSSAHIAHTHHDEPHIRAGVARDFAHEIGERIDYVAKSHDIGWVHWQLSGIRERAFTFAHEIMGSVPREEESREGSHSAPTNTEAADTARARIAELTEALDSIHRDEHDATQAINDIRTQIAAARESTLTSERRRIAAEGRLHEAQARIQVVARERDALVSLRERFEDDIREGIPLIGAAIHGWQQMGVPEGALTEARAAQDKRRREIERLKIKIEEAGIGNSEEVMREFRHTTERDEFLAKELVDLENTVRSLKDIIADLERTIDGRFAEGITSINTALHTFFTQLFGGGDARLILEEPRTDGADDDERLYAGLTVDISLPRKKVRGLDALSGGERALTSIALIFAMSQVNPPPFLILDETDAALDEANSKRYADMIRVLGEHSQLIVITHNRSTMAAAGELYGVTMGHDGVSKLLAVQLEEATKVAK